MGLVVRKKARREILGKVQPAQIFHRNIVSML